MSCRRWFFLLAVPVLAGLAVCWVSPEARFLLGGAVLGVGYRLQDGLPDFDFRHHEDITPEQVWQEFLRQNSLASSVRQHFPRTTYHPLMALLVCMDARIDTNELVGDTRREYYIVRTAGSALSAKEEDMLELAVNNGVKVIVLTRHTDCAAEKVLADPAGRARYPDLVASLQERDRRIRDFLARPAIAERIASGALLVQQMVIDTRNDHVLTEAEAAPTAQRAASAPDGHDGHTETR